MVDQPSATMMMGYLYMVGSEEKMGISPDFVKAEQVRHAGGEALVARVNLGTALISPSPTPLYAHDPDCFRDNRSPMVCMYVCTSIPIQPVFTHTEQATSTIS